MRCKKMRLDGTGSAELINEEEKAVAGGGGASTADVRDESAERTITRLVIEPRAQDMRSGDH